MQRDNNVTRHMSLLCMHVSRYHIYKYLYLLPEAAEHAWQGYCLKKALHILYNIYGSCVGF
ncbi:hypothetical protein MtrunA17_Chr6g0462361 [Medicago truncatula]|uniref:Uncharacterized protein n=1 Tax=Medicago truncatula TaxID=3880 RepID=A0A396HC67_MEDTR|nr:hypothetical protein MtrunA17_Chr6g0462361 [Medicago truncatula]